jgi:hypothetical protein
MKVRELIEILATMPPDATVVKHFNGCPNEIQRARLVRLISARPNPADPQGHMFAAMFERNHPNMDASLGREDAVELSCS